MNKKDQGKNRYKQKYYNQTPKKSSDIKSVSTNVNKEKQDQNQTSTGGGDNARQKSNQQNQPKKINIFPKLKFFTQKDGEGKTSGNQSDKGHSGKQKSQKVNPAALILNQPNMQNRDRRKVRVNRSFKPYLPAKFTSEVCAFCNKNINNMSNAIINPDKTRFAHFECVMQELKKKYNPRSNQRISYVGNSAFALIEDVKEEGKQKFIIIQQLSYNL